MAKSENIHVRAKDKTIDKLKELSEIVGESQGQVVENALNILYDLATSRLTDKSDDKELLLLIKLILNKI
jgi:uncharacterized protein (DUF1499 family)